MLLLFCVCVCVCVISAACHVYAPVHPHSMRHVLCNFDRGETAPHIHYPRIAKGNTKRKTKHEKKRSFPGACVARSLPNCPCDFLILAAPWSVFRVFFFRLDREAREREEAKRRKEEEKARQVLCYR